MTQGIDEKKLENRMIETILLFKLLLTHRNPSFPWYAAPIMLSPRLAIWEAITHITTSGTFIYLQILKKKKKKENKLSTSL